MGAVESNWLNKVSEMVKPDDFFKTFKADWQSGKSTVSLYQLKA